MVKNVFLIGYMGCGKSTIGRYIAKDMGWQFIDMDSLFEQKHNCTISQFFAQHGEEQFRKEESKVVKELAQTTNSVIATGGGAPCFADNMQVMNAAGLTIYISVEPEDLALRLKKAKDNRPLIANKSDDELVGFIQQQLKAREPHYRKAHMVVDGSALPFSAYKLFIETFPEDEIK